MPCGPRNGIPVALRRRSLFRFDEEELRARKAELFSESEAWVAADHRAAGLPVGSAEEVGDPPQGEAPFGPGEEEEELRAGPGPVVGPIGAVAAGAAENLDEEVWVALESRAGYKLQGAVLVNAVGAEFVRLGDRGVLRRRGEAVAVGVLGMEESREENGPDSRLLELPPAAVGGRADFRVATAATSVADGSDWVLQRIAEQRPGPVQGHYWWR